MNGPELLKFLVSIPSVSGSEHQLAEQLAAILQSEDFAVQREGDNLWFSIGEGRPHLLMISHLDTVPACAGWASDAQTPVTAGDKLIGLGANDAKGCVAAMIMAARTLRGAPLEGKVTFAFVVREETDGEGVRTTRPRLGAIDAAVIGEPTALEICNTQRGMLLLRCAAYGEAAHVAHAHLGKNAIHQAARDISRLAAMQFEPHEKLGISRPQVTEIAGGTARNQVPGRCEFFVDIRTTPNLDHAELAKRIAEELEGEVTVHSARYEPAATEEREPIVRAALAAAGKAKPVGSVTTSDWAFLRDIPTVKAGPGDTARSHRPNEYLHFTELEAGAEFYAALARAYFALVTKEVAHV